MRVFLVVAAVAIAMAPAAHAQFTTTPNIYGKPQYGSTTRAPDGTTWQTTPNIYGQPQYGSTTRGSDGSICTTRPNIYGQPQYGSTTTCQ